MTVQIDHRVSVFFVVRVLNRATQLRRHGLHTIANTQHRHALLKNCVISAWRLLGRYRLWPARQNNAFSFKTGNCLHRRVKGIDLAVDTGLANISRDQLRVLRAEIYDQYVVSMWIVHMSWR